MMSKLNYLDKIVQTLNEHGFGAKAIRASYPDKKPSLSTLQTIIAVGWMRRVQL